MLSRPLVILDAWGRRINEIFDPTDLDRLHQIADVVWGRDEPLPEDIMSAAKAKAFAIVTAQWRYGSIHDAPTLRAILEVSGGLPSPQVLDYAACFARGVRVLSCAPAFGPMVAEAALAMALAACRNVVSGHEDFRRAQERYCHAGNQGTFTLYGKTVGMIGFGGLARSLKPLLMPFGVQILAYDPWLAASYLRRHGVSPVDLTTLLSRSQVIFVLAVPSPENKGLLDRQKLALISPGAVLVLISRAHLVDFDALTETLTQGRLRAAIDVFPQEPLPPDHPIRSAPNVVLTPHTAGSVAEGLRNIGRMVVDDLEALIQGLPPTQMQIAQPEIVARMR
jgi:phosphoglycerate dehydrogenase-like enzyme